MVKDRWNSVRNGDDNAAYVAEYAGPWYDYMNRGLEGGFGALDLAATAGGASTLAGLAGWPATLRVGAKVGALRPAFVMEGAYEIGKAARDAIVADTRRREKSYEDLAGTERTGRELQRELARGRRFGEGASDASNFISPAAGGKRETALYRRAGVSGKLRSRSWQTDRPTRRGIKTSLWVVWQLY